MGVVDCAACDGTGRTSGMICWFCHGLCAWSTVAPRQPGSTGSGREKRVSARSVLVAPCGRGAAGSCSGWLASAGRRQPPPPSTQQLARGPRTA
jgi:hypothetical protein